MLAKYTLQRIITLKRLMATPKCHIITCSVLLKMLGDLFLKMLIKALVSC